eukprot:NODE_35_length_36362_cov_0.944434.p24 type:complete len:195 gc:universal NODE_35_length_36362_cov_0.944434:3666-4250(+)
MSVFFISILVFASIADIDPSTWMDPSTKSSSSTGQPSTSVQQIPAPSDSQKPTESAKSGNSNSTTAASLSSSSSSGGALQTESNDQSSSTTTISIIVGCAVAVLFGIAITFVCWKRKRQASNQIEFGNKFDTPTSANSDIPQWKRFPSTYNNVDEQGSVSQIQSIAGKSDFGDSVFRSRQYEFEDFNSIYMRSG